MDGPAGPGGAGSLIAKPEDYEIPQVAFDEAPVPVEPPPGLVYSTAPQHALATTDNAYYVLKGPALEIVFAEAAAARLARLAGIPIPPWALGRIRHDSVVYFASRELRLRSGVDALVSMPGVVRNCELLADVVAFDGWIVNVDRNVNNLVAEPAPTQEMPGAVRLYAIDFEKAEVLRGKGQVALATLPPDCWWPREAMLSLCRGQAFPLACCDRIAGLTDGQLHQALDPLLLQLRCPEPFNLNTAIHALLARARNLPALVREVWS